MSKEIIYVGDPMCSWCYGFTKVIQEIRSTFGGRAPLRLMMGGLRPDGTHLVTDSYRRFLRGHWQEIEERTGQPFDLSILDSTGWIYDTEKACRAVVAARRFGPDKDWEVFAATQRGFYFANHDPNDPESYATIGEQVGIPRADFSAAYHDPETVAATQQDFAWARSVGIDAFPTVVLGDGQSLAALTVGYQPFSPLAVKIARWLEC